MAKCTLKALTKNRKKEKKQIKVEGTNIQIEKEWKTNGVSDQQKSRVCNENKK